MIITTQEKDKVGLEYSSRGRFHIPYILSYKGSQGGQAGYMLDWHPGIQGLTPVQGNLSPPPKKPPRVP